MLSCTYYFVDERNNFNIKNKKLLRDTINFQFFDI